MRYLNLLLTMIYLTKHSVREPYANFSDFEINLVYVLEIYRADPHFKENEIRHSRKSPVNNLWDLSYFGLLVNKKKKRTKPRYLWKMTRIRKMKK